ncbi:MAG: protein translocase subunit SecD, partial [Eubacteriales bacterium]|nr:protein translocase subunit SecD [Eubacteriales bacterium]
RLTQNGFTEATVTQNGTSGIRVEIPDVTDPLEVLSLIGSPAELEFRDPSGNVILKGNNVKTAAATMYEGKYAVSFRLDGEGTEKFAEATRNNIGRAISIYLDGQEVSSPTVNSAITGGEGLIEGNFTLEGAQALAIQIQSGALPLVLTQDKADTVSASLGDNALSTSVLAAIIGIALVLLFMALRYRLCGIVADVALVLYIWLVFFLMGVIGTIQLTLPGIAGIVLGIGMAVDANVIIFERIEEEVRAGRSVRSAVTTGFKNAFSAIIDSNVTTIIAAIVLMIFGTGSIRGFANTLLLGVVVSLISAVTVTRFLLKHVANLAADKPKLFVRTKKVKEEAAA